MSRKSMKNMNNNLSSYYAPPPYCCPEEYCVDEPICIKRRHRRRRRCRSVTPPPLPPIIIPIPIPEPTPPPLQVTEYVQDIYPPAQVYTDQVAVGYVAQNTVCQQPCQIQKTESLNCQPAVILPPSSPCIQPQQQFIQQVPSGQCVQQQIMQQLPTGQCVERPLCVGGGGTQTIMASQQPFVSPSNSIGLINSCSSGTKWIS
ncbi:unnamed protein product [Rotaria sp. Silwood1]|nr:unnamed protein product [Rotaria sp. Silwood1]